MFLKKTIDPYNAKAESERVILAAGGRICDWLPPRAAVPAMRGSDAIIARALILNALIEIEFEAPIPVVRAWIETHGLQPHLSAEEKALLAKRNEELSPKERAYVVWSIESLWALLWFGNLIDTLDYDYPIQDFMASLCPSLEKQEDGSKFTKKMRMRSADACFQMLDLYHRLHWWARDNQLKGIIEPNLLYERVVHRRKSLEWVMDAATDWDRIELST